MTDERNKELAEAFLDEIHDDYFCALLDVAIPAAEWAGSVKRTEQFIRTVTAEAREEGIEALQNALTTEEGISRVISDWFEWDNAIKEINKIAEQLKEAAK